MIAGVQPSAVLKIRMQRWAVPNSTPLVTSKNNFVEVFAVRIIQILPQSMNEKVIVTVQVSPNQPPITVLDPSHIGANPLLSIVIGLSPKRTVPSVNHKSVPLSEIIPSNTEVKASVTNMLISSDLNCLSRLMKTEGSCLLPIRHADGKLCNPNCEESYCILSVHTKGSTKADNLCLKCASVISSVPSGNWSALSLHNFDTELISIDCIKSSLTSFAMGLLACNSIEADYVEASLMFTKYLSNYSLPQLSIPLLVAILEHSVLSNLKKREIYLLLIEAMKQTMLQCNTLFLQKWFLEAACDYFSQLISNEAQTSVVNDLPDLKTGLCNIFIQLLITKTDNLIKLAVENTADSVPTRCIIGQLLTIQQMYDQSLTPITDDMIAAINFLSGISEISTNPSASLDFLMAATWQNPKFYLEAAKAVVFLISELVQQKYVFQPKMIAITKACPNLGQNDYYLLQQEKAIESQVNKGEKSHSQAALWYLDLMEKPNLVCCINKKVFCLLKAAIHLDCELTTAKLVPEKVALKNAALTCVYDACQLVTKLHPGMRVFTFQIALEITLRLGTADYTVSTKQYLDAVLAARMFKSLVYNRQFTYLWNIPVEAIQVSCAHFLNHVSYAAHKAYLQVLVEHDESVLPLKTSLLHYQLFENALMYGHTCTIESKSSLLNKRDTMIHKFLDEKGLTIQDISHRMNSPHMQRDGEGWLVPQKSLGEHLQIAKLKGFCLDFSNSSPAIKLLIEPAKDRNGLLSFQDVFDILHLDFNEIFPIKFSLDPPSTTECLHPFNEVRCHPNKLKCTGYMDTLLQADYLLKFLSTGTEVSSNPPFRLRSVQENLIKDLPEYLQHILQPPHLRGYSEMTQHRSWIEAEEILFDDEISQEQISYFIHKVKLVVHSRPLVRGVNGQCYDALHTDFGPDAEFAADFTENYDEISKHFPIFARLGELAKLQFMMQKVYHHLNLLKQTSCLKHEALLSELNQLRSLAPIKESCSDCIWIPAVYTICGCTRFVYGGVALKPSHKNYYDLVGNDCPDSEKQFSWVNVYNNLINPIKGLEIMPGGIYFGIQRHCRVPNYVCEPDGIVCVKLGTTTLVSDALVSSTLPHISCSEADLTTRQTSLSPNLNPLSDGLLSQKNTITPIEAIFSQDVQSSPSEPMEITYESNGECNVGMPDQVRSKPLDPSLELQDESCNLHDSETRKPSTETGDSSSSTPSSPIASSLNEDIVLNTTPITTCHKSYECLDLPNKEIQGGLSSPQGTSEMFSRNEPQTSLPEDQIYLDASSLQTEHSQQSEVKSLGGTSDVHNDLKDSQSISLNEDTYVLQDLDHDLNSQMKIPGNNASQGLFFSESSEEGTNMDIAQSSFTSDQAKSTSKIEKTHSEDLPVDQSLPGGLSESFDSVQNSASHDDLTASNCPKLPKLEETVVSCVSANDEPSASKDGGSHDAVNTSVLHNSFVHSFSESPLNVAIFGKIMQNAGMNLTTLPSTPSVNMTKLHPSLLVREQVKNVIVLRHILDAYNKQGIELHIASQ